ncbi:hypothetical protein H4696_002642 [Amycolatopsis lexingtonensis]|uniref:Uncharacterized protein n=1 Tax=Amycolatopsis lexingtonensis TaxID=218822 RepID=A0ABR9HX82_9PSEU|nr:hypothetical protein [Amycolatopsis lexingtonensis]MBE1495542.1 hypothetical protein [Amycolatopsis lexingtonensis]
MTSRITGNSDSIHSTAQTVAQGAQQSREHTDDHHHGAGFLYENELTDRFGSSYYEVVGNVQAKANEAWEQQNAQSQGLVRADDHLMSAVRAAEQAIRGI